MLRSVTTADSLNFCCWILCNSEKKTYVTFTTFDGQEHYTELTPGI